MLAFGRLFTGVVAVGMFLSSCQDDDETNISTQALIFGSFYNECSGERCVEIYKLDTNKRELSEDTQDKYPLLTPPYDGHYTALPASFYPLAQDLPNLIPNRLFSEANGAIGSPDASDQGGFYLEVTQNGNRRYWFIDTQKSRIPTYLHPLVDTLSTRIPKLP